MKQNEIPTMPNIELNNDQLKLKKNYLKRPVKQININEHADFTTLIDAFGNSSFEARNLGRAAELYHKQIQTDTAIIWSLSGSLFSAGLRQITIDAVRNNLVDVLVCTGALFEQDMLEALGHKHYICDTKLNDGELQELYIDRVYDHLLDEIALRQVDLTFKKIAESIQPKLYSSREFMNLSGKWLSNANNVQDSVMQAAFEKDIPIFIPAINDCSIGIGLAMQDNQKQNMSIDSIKDLKEIAFLKSKCGDSGIVVIGGGVPKNYSQDAVVMAEMLGYNVEKHKFGIQISTADVRDGGLSGSTLREAISWGKNDKKMEDVMIWGEASVFFPLLIGYIFHKMKNKSRNGLHLNDVFNSK
jgi:deoxyhypusine synthase|tara:strand:+ start:1966 stop:3039 length:1074 start_codon:yes stop_codon:yes gene_type:complete